MTQYHFEPETQFYILTIELQIGWVNPLLVRLHKSKIWVRPRDKTKLNDILAIGLNKTENFQPISKHFYVHFVVSEQLSEEI